MRQENEALRTGAVAADEVAPPARSRDGWWRALLSALCIIVATILVPVSIVGAWAQVQLTDEDAFVATLAPLVDDPAVQAMIIDESMEADQCPGRLPGDHLDVFDGIAGLGLPPRAADALQLLEAPAANGLESLVTTTVTRVVESDAFAEVWATATRAAHRALVGISTSDGGGLVVRTDDGVGIQLGAVVERVKQNLLDRGSGPRSSSPPSTGHHPRRRREPRDDPHELRRCELARDLASRSSPSGCSPSASSSPAVAASPCSGPESDSRSAAPRSR